MPKINMLFQLLTREAYQSPETLVCTQLWTELLQEQINEFTYLASMAGLHCDVSHGSNGKD
jgi:secreted Zn-dependent insulinase-like peptidase